MHRLFALALLGSTLLVPAMAAEVYRTVGPNGEVHYTDEPPSKEAKPVKLPPIQVVGPPSRATPAITPPITAVDAGGDGSLGATILSPAADQSLRVSNGVLPVTVSLARPLPEGHGLMYLLDGSPQHTKATRNLNFEMQGVGRGDHLISVVTVDASGAEIARAKPVVVHIKP